MNNILIISNDRCFSRMIELELLEYGFSVIMNKNPDSNIDVAALINSIRLSESNLPELVILDADICTGKSPEYLKDILSSLNELNVQSILFASEELSRSIADFAFFPKVKKCFVRPFSISEFLYEVSKIVKNKKIDFLFSKNESPYNAADDIKILKSEHIVTFRNNNILLTRREFDILCYLMERRGYTVSRQELDKVIWGENTNVKTNITDVYIRYLRKKIEEKFHVKLIYTIRGIGYMIKL